MAFSLNDRSGLLVLKVRLVADSDRREPARITAEVTTTFDLSTRSDEQASLSGSVDDLVGFVRRWLDEFSRHAIE